MKQTLFFLLLLIVYVLDYKTMDEDLKKSKADFTALCTSHAYVPFSNPKTPLGTYTKKLDGVFLNPASLPGSESNDAMANLSEHLDDSARGSAQGFRFTQMTQKEKIEMRTK